MDAGFVWLFAAATLCLMHPASGSPGHMAVAVAGLLALTMLLAFRSLDLYAPPRILNLRSSLMPLGLGSMAAGATLAAAIHAQDSHVLADVAAATLLAAGCLALLMTNRLVLRAAPRLFGLNTPFASTYVVVGLAAECQAFADALRRDPRRYRLAGVLPLDEAACDGAGKLTPAMRRRLHLLIQQQPVDAVVIAVPLGLPAVIRAVAETARCHPAQVLLSLADAVPTRLGPRSAPAHEVGEHTLAPIASRPLAGWAWVAKEVTDRLLALLLLALLAPVMTVIAIGIRCSSPGPIFFRQIRQGFANRSFVILKFRTMHHRPRAADRSRPLQLTSKDDRRIFAFGRLLRRTSLDELPQLINVVKGDMWLVGPRPHSPLACAAGTPYAEVIEDYVARHRLKPGITGWAQVNGWRGPTETLDQIACRVQHDMHYVENWSPLLDLRILLATARSGFGGENTF